MENKTKIAIVTYEAFRAIDMCEFGTRPAHWHELSEETRKKMIRGENIPPTAEVARLTVAIRSAIESCDELK